MKKILVATDGSENAELAIRQSAKLAKTLGMKLEVLHVIDKHMYVVHGQVKQDIKKKLTEEAEKAVEKAKDICSEELSEFTVTIEDGYSHEVIVEKAKNDESIALVVLGAGGKDFLDRRLLGSVTEHVVQHVGVNLPCSVLVVAGDMLGEARKLI